MDVAMDCSSMKSMVTVDEIKSTAGELAAIPAHSYPVHWAQAKVYAYIIAKEQGLSRIQVQLTYVQTASGEQTRFQEEISLAELESSSIRWWSLMRHTQR